MNTLVSFEIAKLLKEKGFEQKSTDNGYNLNGENSFDYTIDRINGVGIAAPTIAEVIMWLYEKHDIWISLIPDSSSGHRLLERSFSVSIFRFKMNLNVQAEILRKDRNILYFNLPENAFEYAIEYTLKNIIK